MAINSIAWEELSDFEKLALVAAGEDSPLSFLSLWFNITQSEPLKINWHHHYYNYIAKKIISGESQNNIINVTPGGTKTEFWSIHFPAYCFSKFDRVRILNASYSKDLADENSARTRALINSSEFQEFYKFEFGKNKIDDWTLNKNGKRIHQIFSRSSGGQILGVRGGYMTGKNFSGYINADDWDKIDDLFSETKRKKSHTRLINTLRSRRADTKTPFIFIQQRGHIEDSTNFLLSGGMGLKINSHIKIPALIDNEYINNLPTKDLRDRCRRDVCNHDSENGFYSYWPEKESLEDLVLLRDAHTYTFASQYMQDPEKISGDIFREEDFLFYGDINDGADIETPNYFEYRIITADTAQKTKNHNDFSVFAEWGIFQNKIFLINLFRKKIEATELRKLFEFFCLSAYKKNDAYNGNLRAVYVEDKSSGTGLIQEVDRKIPIGITAIQRNVDKLTRAMDCQPHHSRQCIVLPANNPDNYEFITEVTSFKADDSHKHDDQTDVMLDAITEILIKPKIGKGPQVYSKKRR